MDLRLSRFRHEKRGSARDFPWHGVSEVTREIESLVALFPATPATNRVMANYVLAGLTFRPAGSA
jgi:hypothetical protein